MQRYEIEYRRTPDGEENDLDSRWRRYERAAPGIDEGSFTVLGLELDVEYDVRVRTVDDETGAFSEWVTYEGRVVEKDALGPSAPSQVRLTKNDCLTWEMPEETLDLRGFRVRWISCPCHDDDYLTAEIVHEGLVDHAPFLLCRVPKGRGTFFVTAVDYDDNESEPACWCATAARSTTRPSSPSARATRPRSPSPAR